MRTINFMGKRKQAAVMSIILVIASLLIIVFKGVERNVDFVGGTNLLVAFKSSDVSISDLRDRVNQVEPKAAIVRVQSATGANFSIKIKNPEVEEGKESEASINRLRNLEKAFASINTEDEAILDLIKAISEENLFLGLLRENPLTLTGADEVREQQYRDLAGQIKQQANTASTLDALVQAVGGDKMASVNQALHLNFPALNRTTKDLLGAILVREDPLKRGDNSNYEDIASEIDRIRSDQGDFISTWDQVAGQIQGQENEDMASLESFLQSNFTLGEYAIQSNETFSPSIAAELLNKAWGAIILALIGILMYVGARFDFNYAVSSVVALGHDVTIALGFFALVGAELSNPVVAAFLTIVGYSLNDTIVVFDRIRDNLNSSKRRNLVDLMNTSINQTLSRTLVTSITTFFVVMVIFLASNATLRDFALPLLVGIVVGTYSSIFVASPFLLFLSNRKSTT